MSTALLVTLLPRGGLLSKSNKVTRCIVGTTACMEHYSSPRATYVRCMVLLDSTYCSLFPQGEK